MHVYVICNGDGKIYVGATGNLRRRLKQHRSGGVKSTAGGCLRWQLLRSYYNPKAELVAKLETFLHREQHRQGEASLLEFIHVYRYFSNAVISMLRDIPLNKHFVEVAKT